MRPGDVRREGSGRERGKVGKVPHPLLYFSPDPARPAPAFSIDPTDREPGTGYTKIISNSLPQIFSESIRYLLCGYRKANNHI